MFCFFVFQVDDQMKLLQHSWSDLLILDHLHQRIHNRLQVNRWIDNLCICLYSVYLFVYNQMPLLLVIMWINHIEVIFFAVLFTHDDMRPWWIQRYREWYVLNCMSYLTRLQKHPKLISNFSAGWNHTSQWTEVWLAVPGAIGNNSVRRSFSCYSQ